MTLDVPAFLRGADPVALYAAGLSTLLAVAGVYRFFWVDRPRLSVVVTADWPEFKADRYSDLGGDPGPMYVRLEVTNKGRRPVTLRAAGLTLKFVEGGNTVGGLTRAWIESVFYRMRGRADEVYGMPLRDVLRLAWRRLRRQPDLAHVSLLPDSVRANVRLGEGESWPLSRPAEEVAWRVADQPRGPAVPYGAYAERSTGQVHYWRIKGLDQGLRIMDWLTYPPLEEAAAAEETESPA